MKGSLQKESLIQKLFFDGYFKKSRLLSNSLLKIFVAKTGENLARDGELGPYLAGGARDCVWMGTRAPIHLPVIAAGVSKIIATAGIKKIAVNSVVRKLGARRVLADLRDASAALRQRSPHAYSAEAFERVSAGLDTLERSLHGLQQNEQALRVWRWFETLEKNYPSLYAAVFKSYVETWTPVKWAAALMRDASSRASARDAEAPPARAPHAHAAGEPLEAEGRAEAREQITLLQKLHRAAPELNRYHVLLIPKDVESEDVSTKHE